MKNFTHKVIAVSGAGSGIGKYLALQLAQQGAYLALNDWNAEALHQTASHIEAQGGRVLSATFDVADRAAWEQFLQQTLVEYGHVDGLINNAGATIFSGALLDVSPADFERVLNTNLWGTIHGTQVFVPAMRLRPEAMLVNVNSLLGLVGYAGQGAYSTSKFAMRGFTEVLRQELKGTTVKVFQVHPGPIRTNLLRNTAHDNDTLIEAWAAAYDKAAPTSSEQAAQTILSGIQRGNIRIVFGYKTKLLDRIARLLPHLYHRFIPSNFRDGKMHKTVVQEVKAAPKSAAQAKPVG